MTPGARLQAAIDILQEIDESRLPADEILRSWGRANRYAGSGDRSSIRDTVFAALRHKGSAAQLMGNTSPRSIVLGGLRLSKGWSMAQFGETLGHGKYAAPSLSEAERAALEKDVAIDATLDWPQWQADLLRASHGADAGVLMATLLETAPLDLRVNVLKANRETMLAALTAVGFDAEPTPGSPWGIRIAREQGLGGANVRTLPIFRNGSLEIQDEGSQRAALASGAKPGEFLVDLCAGGGGKTLALAAMMEDTGRLVACDVDERRMRAGSERVERAGLSSVEHVLLSDWTPQDGGLDPQCAEFQSKADHVFLDVPCSGSGAWRRQPEAKWRLGEGDLARLVATQERILQRGAVMVKTGGRLTYVTCSVFAPENEHQVDNFLQTPMGANFTLVGSPHHLNPISTGTDGFFIAVLERQK